MVGPFNVNVVSLDSTDPETGHWDADQVAANARRAIADRNTIAYLGDSGSGASALSLPMLNEAGVLQISPSDRLRRADEAGRARRARPLLPVGRPFVRPHRAGGRLQADASSRRCATRASAASRSPRTASSRRSASRVLSRTRS